MTRLSKRVVWVFALFCLLFFGLNLRMAYLQNSDSLREAAVSQRSYTLYSICSGWVKRWF